jgi:hypothetical protein
MGVILERQISLVELRRLTSQLGPKRPRRVLKPGPQARSRIGLAAAQRLRELGAPPPTIWY